ncbi:MAG: hypothetical protein AAF921_10100 [Cyanobacteria bacterium P01_D01_bin.44]
MADYEDWDEPIQAFDKPRAKEKCKNLAQQYSTDADWVELLDTTYQDQPENAQNRHHNWRCWFRTHHQGKADG